VELIGGWIERAKGEVQKGEREAQVIPEVSSKPRIPIEI
jgi:hypothetical protein